MIELNMRDVLPQTRAAYEARQLEAQTSPGLGCTYSGPCAIGAAINPYLRSKLDEYVQTAGRGGIGNLIAIGAVSIPEEQHKDFIQLQLAHDNWTRVYSIQRDTKEILFLEKLEELERKYATS